MSSEPKPPRPADPAEAPAESSVFVAVTKEYDRPPEIVARDAERAAAQLRTEMHGTGVGTSGSSGTPEAGRAPAARRISDETPYVPVTRVQGGVARASRPEQRAPAAGSEPASLASSVLESVVASSAPEPSVPGQVAERAGDPLAGTPYRTIAKLGAGGMGEVYEAEDLETRERVVVKLLLADRCSDSFIDRMRLEAESLALLEHPNIVQVSRFSKTPDGRSYVAMERLRGRTLMDDVRARGPRPFEEAVGDTIQILSGLAAAHGRGIVHRDIKPQNIFVCSSAAAGQSIKILDFGLAKTLADVETSQQPAPLAYPTAEGVFVGTARYAAPEQIRCAEVDARTDIYSTALVLLTMLTGEQPYEDVQGQRNVLFAQLNRSPLDGVDLSHVPEALTGVLRKALAKKPDDRFVTAIGFSDALRAALKGEWSALPNATASTHVDRPDPSAGEAEPTAPPQAASAQPTVPLKSVAFVLAAAVLLGLVVVLVLQWGLR